MTTGPENKYGNLPEDPDRQSVSPTTPLHFQPSALALVFLGGIVGTAIRYEIEEALPRDAADWPWATFTINIAGAFLLGAVLEGLTRLGPDSGWRQKIRLAAGTGLCGAFTTYSTLALETSLLGRAGHVGTAIAYAILTVILGAVAAWAGIAASASIDRRKPSTP